MRLRVLGAPETCRLRPLFVEDGYKSPAGPEDLDCFLGQTVSQQFSLLLNTTKAICVASHLCVFCDQLNAIAHGSVPVHYRHSVSPVPKP